MAKHETLSKRQEQLRRQLFGKEVTVSKSSYKVSPAKNESPKAQTTYSYTSEQKEDTAFLTSDLLKIATLASLAIAIQLLLYWALNNHLIKLPFFG